MTSERWTPPFRRYQIRTGLSLALYVIMLLLVRRIVGDVPSGVPRYVLALLPALCIIGVIVALGRYLAEERDEYIRYQVVLRILWATGATLVVTTVRGFLELFTDIAHMHLYYVAVLWFLFFAFANLLTRWTTR